MARKIITCTACKARFDVARYPAGSRVRCGRCSQVLTVPADGEPKARGRAGTAPIPKGQRRGPNSTIASTRTAGRGRAAARGPGEMAPSPKPDISSTQAPPVTSAIGGATTSDRDPLLGQVIHDQYRVVRKLGEGGYGAVYEAKDVNLERRVAVKVMLRSRAQNREYVSKFLREARTAAQLAHPNVTTIHSVGYDRATGVHFLAMEFVEGRTLHDVLQERGPLPLDEATDYIIQCCRGLAAAHERNIIHRDIKPGNLMITPGNAIKITDFGLAKVYDPQGEQSTVIGTPYFMPPEQFEGKAKDGRTDIYALGVTFYYMLTMKRPHTGSGPAQILLSVMTKEPKSVCELRPELPEECWPIVYKMIHRDPEQRYHDCMDIVHDLEALRGGGGGEDAEAIYCPKCGVPNAVSAQACKECSESLLETCPVCGTEDMAGTRFCGDCGSNIPEERAVSALVDEARSLMAEGQIERAHERLGQARERSAENVSVVQLAQELATRQQEWEQHRDAIRELLAQGRPQEALERIELARNDFGASDELQELETDAHSAFAAQDPEAAADQEAVENARHLEDEGRIREALVAWRGVLVLAPDNEEARTAEGNLARRVERSEQLFAEATELLDAGDPELAVERLLQANTILPGDMLIEGRMDEARRMAAELRAELDQIETRIQQSPSTADLGRLSALHGRYPGSEAVAEALRLAESAGRQAPDAGSGDRLDRVLQAARAAEEERRPRDAIAAWRELWALKPDDDEAVLGMARAEQQLTHFDALLAQSRTLLDSGDPEGAAERAQQALEIVAYDPSGEAQAARARTSVETMRHEAERIRTALRADHEDEQEAVLEWAQDLANQFAGAQLPMDVLRETETAFRDAAEESLPERIQKSLGRAVKLEQEGNLRAALGAFETVLRLAPNQEDAGPGRARTAERISRGEQKAREAAVQLDRGDPEAARETAEAALELLPDQPDVAATLAGARAATGEIDRLTKTFREDLEPDAAEAQRARFERLRTRYPGSPKCIETFARAQALVESVRRERDAADVDTALRNAEEALATGRLSDAATAAEALVGSPAASDRAAAILERVGARRTRADELLREAQEASGATRHADALRLYRAAQSENPELPGTAEGAAAAEQALAEAAERLQTAVGAAESAAAAGRARETLSAWQEVLAIAPGDERATAESERLSQSITTADAAATRGRDLLNGGDPDGAVAPLREALDVLGDEDGLADALSRAEAGARELNESLDALRAELTTGEGDLAETARRAAQLADRFPGSTAAAELRADAEQAARQRLEAEGIAEVRSLVEARRFTQAIDRAAQLRAQGIASPELQAAVDEAQKAKDDLRALHDRLSAARSQGRLEDARDTCRQILGHAPDDPEAQAALTQIEETLRNVGARREEAEEARRRGDVEQALLVYRDVATLNAADENVANTVLRLQREVQERRDSLQKCDAALQRGDTADCTQLCDDLLSRYPEDRDAKELRTTADALKTAVDTLLARARRQVEAGQTKSAASSLDLILRIVPGHAEARSLRDR